MSCRGDQYVPLGPTLAAAEQRLRLFLQRLAQDINDLRAENVVPLKVRKHLDEVVIASLMELSNDVRTDIGLGRQDSQEVATNGLRQLGEPFDRIIHS